jgi:protein-tyrosine phosphatase
MSLRILVVCEGNVCRSPLAERLLAARLPSAQVSSAGTRALVGAPMDPSTAAEVVRLGGSPEGFLARQLTGAQIDGSDLVLTATTRIRSQVLGESPRALRRTLTLLELAALAPQAPPGSPAEVVAWAAAHRAQAADGPLDVRDPIGRSPEAHRQVADVIDRAVRTIATALTPRVSC